MDTPINLPLLTIGIISWNRLHYFRATLESARRCIQYPKIQWIVVDNLSTEPGLAGYLKSCDWIDELIFLKSDHVTAMNEIVARAKGEVLLLWPDDMQFVVEGDWMMDFIEVLLKHKRLGSMAINFLRHQTIQSIWKPPLLQKIKPMLREFKQYKSHFRLQRKIGSSRGAKFHTFGWADWGIIASGIPSLTRVETWQKLGPWRSPGDTRLLDSSGGGEMDMGLRWQKSNLALNRIMPSLPVAADIINDDIGCKAKVRGNVRYGVYSPPPEGTFYYQIKTLDENRPLTKNKLPVAFEDFVQPIGFNLPLDDEGGLLKSGMNLSVQTEI